MIQQGQPQAEDAVRDGRPLWAYRYRLHGREPARPPVGGFSSRAEAEDALRKVLVRRARGADDGRGSGRGEPGMHQAEPVTIAKLRWLLGKATGALGPVRLSRARERRRADGAVLGSEGDRGRDRRRDRTSARVAVLAAVDRERVPAPSPRRYAVSRFSPSPRG
jgi:hypothetical protein